MHEQSKSDSVDFPKIDPNRSTKFNFDDRKKFMIGNKTLGKSALALSFKKFIFEARAISNLGDLPKEIKKSCSIISNDNEINPAQSKCDNYKMKRAKSVICTAMFSGEADKTRRKSKPAGYHKGQSINNNIKSYGHSANRIPRTIYSSKTGEVEISSTEASDDLETFGKRTDCSEVSGSGARYFIRQSLSLGNNEDLEKDQRKKIDRRTPAHIPAPKRMGCGLKIDKAVLDSLLQNATWQVRPPSAPTMGFSEQPLPDSVTSPPENVTNPKEKKHPAQTSLSPQYLFPPNIIFPKPVLKKHLQGDHLSPQYLFPPNFLFANHSLKAEQNLPEQGDRLSPQFLNPPNPSSKLEISSKKPTPWYGPGRDADKNLSPQYLFPPNFWIEAREWPHTIRTGFEKVERDSLGDQKLSPQYLFPPTLGAHPSLRITSQKTTGAPQPP